MEQIALIQAAGPASTVYKSGFTEVTATPVLFPNGVHGVYERVNPGRVGGVAIPRNVHRGITRYGLVRQHRFPVDQVTLEFPRGGTADGSAAETMRELTEETGLTADATTAIPLGTIHADTGVLATQITVWLIPVLDLGDAAFVEAETGAQHLWLTDGEIDGMISRDQITCGITLAALAKLRASSYRVAPGQFL